jgi:hypothetical protein
MRNELAQEICALIEARSTARPTPMEFEMAYQARVAMDRIKFAIKHTEKFGPHTEQMREAGLQLLDALQRLETADRRFQKRSQVPRGRTPENNNPGMDDFSPHDLRASHQANGERNADR